jgi:diaminopimelate epimerase
MQVLKYQSTGNDFILLKGPIKNPSKFAIAVCDRHFGIGADGILFSTASKSADIKMNYYNADGTIAPMCGNGLRAFAHFVMAQGLVKKNKFVVETLAGPMRVKKVKANIFEIDLGVADYNLETPDLKQKTTKLTKLNLEIEGKNYQLIPLFLGTLHGVVIVNNIDKIDVLNLGDKLCHHPQFPKFINVNFVEVVNNKLIKVSTYERGVGPTLSCGTGVSSAVNVTTTLGLTENKVKVIVPGGTLMVKVEETTTLTGPTKLIAKIDLVGGR